MNSQNSYFNQSPLGLYVHVPFCPSNCDYCAFYHEAPQREAIELWLNGIEKESQISPLPRAAETFFIGGGTPGILDAKLLEKLGSLLLKSNHGKAPNEWSIELAPSTVKPDKLKALKALGVNRISLGVQSFDNETLKLLGRRHSRAQIESAFEMLRDAGFKNINIDLIFAVPGENKKRWEEDLKQAFAIAPEHISAYCLILEENAPLLAKLKKSPFFDPKEKSPEYEAELYLKTWEILENAGYKQYEIANFSRESQNQERQYQCQHNLNTWRMHEWLGWGPAAASQCHGKRFTNPANLKTWLDSISSGSPTYVDTMSLNPEILFADSILFGLRLNEGINLNKLAQRFRNGPNDIPQKLLAFFENLKDADYLGSNAPAGTIVLNPKGRLVADAIAEGVLENIE